MKISTRVLLCFFLFITVFTARTYAQCSGGVNSGTSVFACNSNSALTVDQGNYMLFSVVSNVSYNFNTTSTSYDCRIYGAQNGVGGALQFDQDIDNLSGNNETIDWTATYTGTIGVAIHYYSCPIWNGTSAVLNYKQNTTVSNTTSSATICVGDTKALTYTLAGLHNNPVPTWSIVGGSGSISGSTFTATTAGSVTVRATLGVCTSDVTFTVNSLSNPPTGITGTTTICNGSSTTLTLSGGSAGTGATAEWFSGSCGGTSAGTGSSITVSPTSTTSYYVRYSGTCNTTSCASTTVTVNTLSTAPSGITGTTTICNGTSTTLFVSGGSLGTGAVYNWYSGSCGGTFLGSGTSISVSPTSTTNYFVRAQGTCNTTGCASTTVTVNQNSTAPSSITASPSTLCTGGSSTLTQNGGSLGTGATFNWYTVSCGGTSAGTGNSISVSPGSTTTYFVRAEGTCNITGCVSTAVTVNSYPTDLVPAATASAICSGTSTTITIPTSQSNVSYQLRIGITNVGLAQTGNGGTLTFSTGNLTSNTTFNVLATNNYGAACSIQLSTPVTITVQNLPSVYTVTGGGSYCAGGSGVAVGLSNSQSGVNYQLQLNGSNIGGAVAGSGAAISFGNQTTAGTYTVIAAQSPSPNCSATMTGSVVVTINPYPSAAGTISGTAIVCQAQTGVAYSVSAIANATTYNWAYSGTGGTVVGTGNSISMNFTGSATSGNLTVYGSNACGNGTVSANFSITVNQTPAATATPSTATVCSGNAPSPVISLSSTIGGTSYTWTTSQTSGITGASNCASSCGTSINQVLSNSGTAPGTATYTITPTANGCSGSTIPVVITVNPTPVGSAIGQTICSGATTNITLNSTLGGTSYTWNASLFSGSSTTGFGPCVSSCGTTITQTLTNSSTAPATVRYTVTPTTAGCPGSSFTVDVIVNPIPVATATNNAPSICSGSATNIALTSSVNGTNFSWTASGTPGTGGYSGSSGSTIAQTLTNTNPPSGIVTYVITPTANSCSGSSISAGVTVYQQPTADAGNLADMCVSTSYPVSSTLSAASPSPSGSTGAWTQVSGPTAIIFTPSSNTSAVQYPSPGVYTFRWTVTNVVPGCSAFDDVTINVYTQPIAFAGNDATQCDLDYTMTATPANAGTGTWIRVSGPAGFSFSNANSPTSTVTVTGYGTHVFRWTVVNGSCSAQDEVTIIFYNQPVAVAGSGGSECDLDFTFNASLNVGTGTWTQQSGPGTTTYSPNANSATATATASTFGTYVYRWTGVNGTCSNFSQVTVNYYDLPDAIITGDTTICWDGTATISIALTGQSPWSVTYEDNLGNPTTVTGITTSPYTFTTTDSLSFIVTDVTDGNGCSNEGSGEATVEKFPPPAVPTISGGLTSFCQGQSQIFFSSVAEGYVWSPTNETGQFILVNTSGTYTVTTTDINGCNQTSLPTVVTVHPNPVPVITPGGPISLCAGQNVTLATTLSYSSYSWSNGATTASINVNSTNNYSVTVTDVNGCQGTSSAVAVIVHPLPTPTITPFGNGTTFCQGQSVNLLASGAASYVWSPGGQTSQVISVNASGSYSVTVTDANGCVNTSAATVITVISNPTPTISSGGPLTFCQGGSVTLTSSSVSGNVWSPGGQTTQAITVNSSGNYSVTVTNGNGCSGTSAITTVTVNPPPTAFITAGGSTTFCQGGSVTLTSNSATGNVWSPGGQTTQSITASAAGNYTVTVTNGNNCSATSPIVTVTVNPNPAPSISAGGPTTFCQGGSVVLTSTIATGNVWSPNGQNTQSITVSASGTYSVTNTNGNGCSATSNAITVTVNPNPAPTISASGSTSFCVGGSVTLTSSSATGNVWSPGGQVTQSITVSTSGNYSVTVTDGNSCSGTSAATTVTVNPLPTPTVTPQGPTTFCQGGSVVLSSNSLTGNVWSPGAQTTQNITVTASGNYSVTITDVNGCTASSSSVSVTVNPNPTPTISASGPLTFCQGGSVTLTSSSATNNSWSLGLETTQSITVSTSGNYRVSVTDGNGCSGLSAITVVTVNPLPTPTITPDGGTTFCTGGSVNLTSSSASSYVWSPDGQTTQTINVTASGNYSVTVVDANGCTGISATTTVTVTALPAPVITPMGPTTFCQGGSVTLFSSSSTGNVWSPGGATTQFITVSATATYTVTVTTGGGCDGTSAPVTVTVNPLPTPTISASGATTFCSGGSVTLTSSAASSYLWSNGATTQATVINSSGAYSITVTDGNGCQGTSAATSVIVNPLPVPTIATSGPTTFCSGGSVTLTSSAASTYLWSNSATTQSITVSASGTFNVFVTDANGCTATSANTVVTVNPLPTPTITPGGLTTFCNGGSVTLTSNYVSGNLWSTGAVTQSITVSASGSYTVTETDGNGCTATSSATTVTVNPNPTPTITAGGPTTFCQGGSVTLTSSAAAGYLWSTGATTQAITVSSSGTFTVTVTDGNGCSGTSAATTVTVNPLPAPTVTPLGPTTFCSGGDVTLFSNIGSGNVWSPNGETTQFITVSTSGSYSVTVTNGSGCSASSAPVTVTVNPLPTPTISASGATTFCSGGSVTLTASAASAYVWSNGATTQAITVSSSGTFTVTVTDANGCTATSASTTVTVNPLPVPTITPAGTVSICNGSSTTLTASSASSYVWSTTETTQSIVVSAAGSYNVTVTDANGCSATSQPTTVTLQNNPVPIITPLGPTTFCQGGSVMLYSSQASNYLWSPNGETTQIIVVNQSGSYTVSVSDGNGCTGTSAPTIVTVNPSPTVSFAGLDPEYCVDGSAVILTGSPVGGSFTGPVIGNTFNPSLAGVGTYTVTYSYTNGSGCTGSASQQVIVHPLPVVSFSGLDEEYCVDAPGITLVGNPGGGTFSGPGISGTTFSPASAGAGTHSITYTYTDANSCTKTSTQTVIVNPLPVLSINGLNAAYCVDAGNTTLSGSPSGGTFSGAGISGNTFSPSVAGVGTHTITYAYTDGNGCSNTTTQSVTINALPVVSFNVLAAQYCISETSVTLIGSPTGGSFSGTGVTGNIFNPSIAGAGSHVITYTYTDGNGCTSSFSRTAVVVPLPVVNFTGLDPEYCLDAGIITLTGSPSGGTFTGAGISGNTINIATAGVGQHTITYTYTDGFGCTNSTSQNVVIHALPVVSFSGLGLDYCVDENTAILNGYPPGGTFSGPGISGNTFSPSTAGPGVHTVTFTYTDGNGCTATLSQVVTVYDLPVVDIDPIGTQYCISETTVTLSATPSGGIFSGPGVIGTNFNPSVAGIGNHRVVYAYSDGNGCENRDTIYFDVVSLPVVDFTGFQSQYCVDVTVVSLVGSPSGGTFTGPGISGNNFNPSVAGVGTHTITYTYSDGNGCTNSASHTITVNPLPVVDFTGLDAGYCLDAAPVILTGLPAGGGYFGDGINGNIFTPADAGVGTHTITYAYINTNGCLGTAEHVTEVFDLPSLSITNLDAEYCLTDPNVTLVAVPGGGTFSGSGISGNDFSPSSAGVGTHSITYSYTDGNQCSNSITQQVVVNPLPALSLLGLASSYCDGDNAAVQLTGVPSGGIFSGNGVTGDQFFPAAAGVGLHPISYTYSDANGCSNVITQNVVVNPLPTPSFTISASYCISQSTVTLQGIPSGGTFSGPGVFGNTFTPFDAGLGTHTIVYSVTDINGCTGTASETTTVNDLPVVTIIGLDALYCFEEAPVTVTGSPSGGTLFGPGISGNTFDPALSGNGMHTVTYSYIDGNGCSNTTTQQVQVLQLAPPIISVNGPLNFCEGDNVTLTAQSGFNSYEWSTGANSASILVDEAGQYSVTVTDVNGCTATSTPLINVSVYALPVVDLGDDVSICPGTQVTLDAGPGFDEYIWFPGGETTQTITVSAAGDYRASVTNANGCFNYDEVTISVFTPQVPVITANGSPSICDGEILVLNAGSGFQEYLWSNTITTQLNTVSQSGSYTVTTVDMNGCLATSSPFNVTVIPLPIVTIFANGPTDICEGNNLTLSMPAGYSSYLWSTGETTNSINVDQEGDYFGSATNSAGCSNETPTIHVAVNPQPQPVIVPQGLITLCFGETIMLDAGNEGYDTYNWFRNLSPMNIYTQLNSVGVSGNYTVEVIDTNGCGQGITSPPVQVTVFPELIPIITISPGQDTLFSSVAQTYQWYLNGNQIASAVQQYYVPSESGNYEVIVTDDNNCEGTSATIEYSYIGIDDITFISLNLYPNPGSGSFTIRGELSQTMTLGITFTDIIGRTIMPGVEIKDVSSLNKNFSLEEFAQGVYFIRITAGDKVQKVIRYVKQ